MKKRLLSGLVAVMMILSIFPMMVSSAETGKPEIIFETAETSNGKKDSTVEIKVSIKNNPGFVSATIPVEWDSTEMELESVKDYDIQTRLLEGSAADIGANSGWIAYDPKSEHAKPGLYHLAWNNDIMHDGDKGVKNFTKDGVLCVMVFKLLKDMPDNSEFKISAVIDELVNLMNWNMDDLTEETVSLNSSGVTVEFVDGGVKMKNITFEYELGDVNMDGSIKAVDAAMVYAMANGRLIPTELQKKLADVNGDGAIKAVDAAMVYAKANGRLLKFPAER